MSTQEEYFHKYFEVQEDVAVLLQFLGTQFIWAAMGQAGRETCEGYLTRRFSNLCETTGMLNKILLL